MERGRLIADPHAGVSPSVADGTLPGAFRLTEKQQQPSRRLMSHDTQAPEYNEADRRVPPRTVASPPVVPTPKARQAVTGHNVRYVLGFGLGAIIIAFIIVYLLYFG
jgi:hypothetical protein